MAADAVAVGDLDHGSALATTAWSRSEPSLGCTSSTAYGFAGVPRRHPRGIPQAGMLPHLLVVILLAALNASLRRSSSRYPRLGIFPGKQCRDPLYDRYAHVKNGGLRSSCALGAFSYVLWERPRSARHMVDLIQSQRTLGLTAFALQLNLPESRSPLTPDSCAILQADLRRDLLETGHRNGHELLQGQPKVASASYTSSCSPEGQTPSPSALLHRGHLHAR